MNYPMYIPAIVLGIILLLMSQNRRRAAIMGRVIKKRRSGGCVSMKELAARFIGKECIINSFDGGHQYVGVIKEVTDGAILVEKEGHIEALNLDFVIRIREYPKKKNGKKKSIVLD